RSSAPADSKSSQMRSLTLNIARAFKRSGEAAAQSASPCQVRAYAHRLTRRDAAAVDQPVVSAWQVPEPDRQVTSSRRCSERETELSRTGYADTNLFQAARSARSYRRAVRR